jgi:hypothetical protein
LCWLCFLCPLCCLCFFFCPSTIAGSVNVGSSLTTS